MSVYRGYIDAARTKLRQADNALRNPDDLTLDEVRVVMDGLGQANDFLSVAVQALEREQSATEADEALDLPLAQERG